MGERDHRLHQGRGIRILEHGDDEGTVDLERLHRKPGEIGERGIAGSEIIDRHAHAELVHVEQLLDVDADVLHDQALGDLQVDACRGIALGDCLLQDLDEVALLQLDR